MGERKWENHSRSFYSKPIAVTTCDWPIAVNTCDYPFAAKKSPAANYRSSLIRVELEWSAYTRTVTHLRKFWNGKVIDFFKQRSIAFYIKPFISKRGLSVLIADCSILSMLSSSPKIWSTPRPAYNFKSLSF